MLVENVCATTHTFAKPLSLVSTGTAVVLNDYFMLLFRITPMMPHKFVSLNKPKGKKENVVSIDITFAENINALHRMIKICR